VEVLIPDLDVLVIRKEHVKALVKEALRDLTVEACGLLIGRVEGGRVMVEEVLIGENVKRSSTRFEVDPGLVYRAIIQAEARGLELVGVFHSHPAPPIPSQVDVEGMRLWPIAWLIVSTLDGSYAAYTLKNGEVKPLRLEAADEAFFNP